MKFIAYLLVAANVALGAYYFSTQKEKNSPVQNNTSATLSNLSTKINTPNVKPMAVVNAPTFKTETAVIKRPLVSPPALTCIQISQILEKKTATDIQTKLTGYQINNKLRQKDIVIKTVYAILIGPFSSDNRTNLEIKNLKENKIDYYVLPDGENKGAISLGLYSNKTGALGVVIL